MTAQGHHPDWFQVLFAYGYLQRGLQCSDGGGRRKFFNWVRRSWNRFIRQVWSALDAVHFDDATGFGLTKPIGLPNRSNIVNAPFYEGEPLWITRLNQLHPRVLRCLDNIASMQNVPQ